MIKSALKKRKITIMPADLVFPHHTTFLATTRVIKKKISKRKIECKSTHAHRDHRPKMNSKGSLKVRQSKEAFVFAFNCLGKKTF